MTSVIPWAEIVGSGIAGALIAYPLMYIALANRYKARLTNFANLSLFIVTVPLIGIAEVAFGGSSESISGILALFGAPLVVCFIVVGVAFESRAERAKAEPKVTIEASAKISLARFARPAERIAFLAMIVGLVLLIVGLIGFWANRGYFDQLKYDLAEIFFEDINYRGGWAQWCARIGLVFSVFGFAVAFHYDRTVLPIVRQVYRFAHWVRTGQ
ncbi:MAG: hypothetical protein WCA09_18825 [Burkholderiales bacterium]